MNCDPGEAQQHGRGACAPACGRRPATPAHPVPLCIVLSITAWRVSPGAGRAPWWRWCLPGPFLWAYRAAWRGVL